MGRTIIEFPLSGRCATCGGPWIVAGIDAQNFPEVRCLHCGRPPAPPPPPDLVHAEPVIRWSLRKKEGRP